MATIDHCTVRPLYNAVLLIGKMEDRKLWVQNKPDNDVIAGDGDSSVS